MNSNQEIRKEGGQIEGDSPTGDSTSCAKFFRKGHLEYVKGGSIDIQENVVRVASSACPLALHLVLQIIYPSGCRVLCYFEEP